jgi:hypothetical protein
MASVNLRLLRPRAGACKHPLRDEREDHASCKASPGDTRHRVLLSTFRGTRIGSRRLSIRQ